MILIKKIIIFTIKKKTMKKLIILLTSCFLLLIFSSCGALKEIAQDKENLENEKSKLQIDNKNLKSRIVYLEGKVDDLTLNQNTAYQNLQKKYSSLQFEFGVCEKENISSKSEILLLDKQNLKLTETINSIIPVLNNLEEDFNTTFQSIYDKNTPDVCGALWGFHTRGGESLKILTERLGKNLKEETKTTLFKSKSKQVNNSNRRIIFNKEN